MGKWMIVVPTAFDELHYNGGLLSTLKIKQDQLNIELSTEEKPYVVFCAISDTDNKKIGHIPISQYYREILESSKSLGFNYKVLFSGRDYLNSLHNHMDRLITAIKREINFVRPEYLIIPNYKTDLFGDFYITAQCAYIAANEYKNNILFYNQDLTSGNFYIPIERGFK
jgi:hypothetical protein